MEKINLNKLYNEAVSARIAAEKSKADLFVENVMIPELIEAAENCENCKIFYIPGGLKIAFILEAIKEKVEYTEVKQDENALAFYWGQQIRREMRRFFLAFLFRRITSKQNGIAY